MHPAQVDSGHPDSQVKLVIWDLDDTFWQGTLSEGGIDLSRENAERLVHLARRGVVSSICSKNDFARAREALEEAGLWQYFVFPSIQWSPKGEQVRRILARTKLRAQNVLVVDDNVMNREEIAFANPGIATLSPEEWARTDVSQWGKDDGELARLASYRLLESRSAATDAFPGSNVEFLHQSGVVVTVTPLTAHDDELDRVVELVNRANQLNFTKSRIASGPAELIHYLRYRSATCLKVHVRDRYGDYGMCGLVAVGRGDVLDHFLFSCRVLDMGIEQALLRFVRGRFPGIALRFTPTEELARASDWVRIDERPAACNAPPPRDFAIERPSLLLLHGCAGNAMAPFLERRFRVDSSAVLATASALRRHWSQRFWEPETRAHLRRLFRGEYTEVHLTMALEALFVPLRVPLSGTASAPFWAARRCLDHAEGAERWVLDSLESGRPMFGRALPRMPRRRAALLLGALSLAARRGERVDEGRLFADLERLRRDVPAHTRMVLTVHQDNGTYFTGPLAALNPMAHARIAIANRVAEHAARDLPNTVTFDARPVLNGATIYEHTGHYSHRTYYDLACRMMATRSAHDSLARIAS